MARILAVDDDALARSVLIDALRGLSHDVVAASGGREALERLGEEEFAVVITDVRMPEMDGIELARRVARLENAPPVLLASGATGVEIVAEARASGVQVAGFVPKPLQPSTLKDALSRALSGGMSGTVGWSGEEFLATVDGPLSRFPLVRVLFLAHRVQGSGAVRVRPQGGTELLIGLRGGRVVQVMGAPWILGTLSRELPDHSDLGVDVAYAVDAGFPVDDVLRAACDGLGAQVVALAAARAGHIRWDRGFTPPSSAFPLPVPLPRLISVALRTHRPAQQVANDWAARAMARARLQPPDDSPETAWGIDMTALRIMRLAPAHQRVKELVDAAVGGAPERRPDVLRSMDLLHFLGIIELEGAAATAEPAEPGKDPRVDELQKTLEKMATQQPIELLGLLSRETLDAPGVAKAFRDASARFHPDRYAGAPPEVRAAAAACFDRLRAATEELSAPSAIEEGRLFLEARKRGELYVTTRAATQAKILFRRGEILFRNRDWKGADPLLLEAWKTDPRAWPHALYQAWCGWLSRRLTSADALKLLQSITDFAPNRQAEVFVVMANICKLEGHEDEAQKLYKRALKRDPQNRDAQRELRLFERRTVPTAREKK